MRIDQVVTADPDSTVLTLDELANDARAAKGSLERGIIILKVLAHRTNGLTLREIEEQTQFARSTTYRVLAPLVREALVDYDSATGRYSWGKYPVSSASAPLVLSSSFSPIYLLLARLSQLTNESAGIHVRSGFERVCIVEAESPASLRMSSGIGGRYPLVGAAGWVLRSWDASNGDRNTLKDKRRIEETIQAGWAYSAGETTEGAAAIAVPLFVGGTFVGALNVCGPDTRFDPRDEAVRGHVARIAMEITSSLAENSATARMDGASK